MASPLLIDFLTNEVLPKMILTFFVAHLQAGHLSLGIAEIDSVLLLNCQKYILLLFTFNFDNSHYIEYVYTVPSKYVALIAGLYTEILPMGGEFRVWRKEGGQKLKSIREVLHMLSLWHAKW